MCYLQENNINKVIRQGVPEASPMPKSVISSRERKISNCLGSEFAAYLFVVEGIGIYKGK